jgi:hypothetical protein
MDTIDENELPETLTLEQAFSAAYFMIEIYGDVENWRSEDIVLLHQYMNSDPARWSDWKHAVSRALAHPNAATEYLYDWRQQWGKLDATRTTDRA